MKPRKDAPKIDTKGAPALKQNPFAAALGGLSGTLPEGPSVASETSRPEVHAMEAPKPSGGKLVLRREKKHRGGKTVVLVTGFEAISSLDARAVEALAAELKRTLGCGGTMEEEGGERRIVIQGDDPARVSALLTARGFRVGGVTR